MEVPIGTGSGFVWDEKGHIVTNCKSKQGNARHIVKITVNIFEPMNESSMNSIMAVMLKEKSFLVSSLFVFILFS